MTETWNRPYLRATNAAECSACTHVHHICTQILLWEENYCLGLVGHKGFTFE